AWAVAKGAVPILGVTKVKHVEDAVKAANLNLSESEIKELEALSDKANINTVRVWEKEMK
ncbi:MAG: aldo/keto reductase, partial [Synergistaceae bacterium]|nr:aldo/keto reductase [Synergistaceae bacterium]